MPRLRHLVAALLATVSVALAPGPARAVAGSLAATDGTLFEGCHGYPYSYEITPATSQWYLETFLFGPDGQKLAAGVFLSDSDATTGASAFGVCSRATSRGTFRIEARVTTTSGASQSTEVLDPVTFFLGLPATASGIGVTKPSPRRGQQLAFILSSSRQAPEGMVPNELATVVLQHRTASGWRRVGGGLTETNAEGRTRVRITWQGGRERFRVLTRGVEDEYAGSRSSTLLVRTGR